MWLYVCGFRYSFSMKLLHRKTSFRPRLLLNVSRKCLSSKISPREGNTSKADLKKYSHTIILPKTSFPTKTDPRQEELLQKTTAFSSLYQRQNQRDDVKKFIIHDGPPYANGDVHLGHAVNKIAKDIVARYKVRQGMKVEFIPGWDCHGLPIELKALSDEKTLSANEPVLIREKARHFARSTVEKQKQSFMRWGVMADWDHCYATYNLEFVISQLTAFYDLYDKGLVYKNFMPVYWSPSNQTTLAEAEIDYNENHNGFSVFVKYPISNASHICSAPLFAMIWTTTPWTLPSNQAIAYNKHRPYCVVKSAASGEHFIVASDSIDELKKSLNVNIDIVCTIDPKAFEELLYHSLFGRKEELKFIHSNHVGIKGTGLVHIAPNHGHDDYNAAKLNSVIPMECIVNKQGKFTENAGAELCGKYVLEEGSLKVLELLKENVVREDRFTHSYPYDWRSGQPLLILPTSQWFINIDCIRDRCLECLNDVEFYCNGKELELRHRIQNRPPWCISRQRAWGVPIPAVYRKLDDDRLYPMLSKRFLEHVLSLMKKHGPDIWWSTSLEKMFTSSQWNHTGFGDAPECFTKESDILDVWFDSGLTWNAVLSEPKVADLFLEGIDQTRGWFQSSLILSIALQDRAPYKSVYAHGFTVDKNGKKMSKSVGNVVNPHDLIASCGVDTVRWWVASNISQDKIVFGDIEKYKAELQKIRGTLRFLLAAADEHRVLGAPVEYNKLENLDKAFLAELHSYASDVNSFYSELKINDVAERTFYFLSDYVSSLYVTAIKDRLYCDDTNSLRRRSCLTVLSFVYNIVLQYISPILPHLAQELHLHSKFKQAENVFEESWVDFDNLWFQPTLRKALSDTQSILTALHKNFPGQETKNYEVVLVAEDEEYQQSFKVFQETKISTDSDLVSLLRVSSVTLQNEFPSVEAIKTFKVEAKDSRSPISVHVSETERKLCYRCRRYSNLTDFELCSRCFDVLAKYK